MWNLSCPCSKGSPAAPGWGWEGNTWVGLLGASPNSALLPVPAGGGDVKIENQKLNFKEKAQAKVGSLDNLGHSPAGGAVKVSAGVWHSQGMVLIQFLSSSCCS